MKVKISYISKECENGFTSCEHCKQDKEYCECYEPNGKTIEYSEDENGNPIADKTCKYYIANKDVEAVFDDVVAVKNIYQERFNENEFEYGKSEYTFVIERKNETMELEECDVYFISIDGETVYDKPKGKREETFERYIYGD